MVDFFRDWTKFEGCPKILQDVDLVGCAMVLLEIRRVLLIFRPLKGKWWMIMKEVIISVVSVVKDGIITNIGMINWILRTG